jgi:hypothetical protein
VVTKRAELLEFDAPPDRALVACREAIRSIEWDLGEVGTGRLTASQDPAKLCCHDWPAEIEVEVDPAPGEGSAVTLAGFVPGFGPISSRHLRASLALLERAIRRQLG